MAEMSIPYTGRVNVNDRPLGHTIMWYLNAGICRMSSRNGNFFVINGVVSSKMNAKCYVSMRKERWEVSNLRI